jgi:biotin operon repressor
MATSVIESGNYELFIDTGFLVNSFRLDNSTAGVLDNTTFVLDGSTEFAPMLQYSTNVNLRRGRRDVGDQFSAGIMSFNLNDTLAGGTLNPLYSSSPYVDPNEEFTLAPLRRVSFGRYDSTNTFISLFAGQIVNYDYNYQLGGQNIITVYCADDFYLLAQTALAEFNVTEQLSSARISAVLDLPEVAYPALTRDIETGTQTLGGAAAYTVAEGTNVKAYIDQIQQAEQGRIFMSRTGDFTSQPRVGQTLSGSVADFHDDGTNIPYNSLGIIFNADLIVNRASIQHEGAASPQVANDAASQAKYLIQNTSITNSLLHNDAAALVLANYLLVGEPEATFNAVQTDYLMLTTAQREALALVDIGDTITITNTITGGEVAQELAVEGIEISVNVNNGHRVTFYTAATVIVYEFILNNAIYGKLDIQDPQPVLG